MPGSAEVTRPRSVVVASVSLLLAAPLSLAGGAVNLRALQEVLPEYLAALDHSVIIPGLTNLVWDLKWMVGVGTILAAVLAALGIAVLQRWPWARYSAVVAACLVVIAWGGALVGSPYDPYSPDGEGESRSAEDPFAFLGGYGITLGLIVGALMVASTVVTVALLRTSAAEFYFRGRSVEVFTFDRARARATLIDARTSPDASSTARPGAIDLTERSGGGGVR